jgi:hypothetical protein
MRYLAIALLLPACTWFGSNCKVDAATIAAEYNRRAQVECAKDWPAIKAGDICLPDQPCLQCPLLEEADRKIDKACGTE